MSKQDRQVVRTAPELERKLGGQRKSSPGGSSVDSVQLEQLNQTLQQYMNKTNARFKAFEESIPELDDTLAVDEKGLLGVNTASEVKEGNKLPVTSEAVAMAIASLVLGELPDNVLTQEDLEEVIELINSQEVYIGDNPPDTAKVWINPDEEPIVFASMEDVADAITEAMSELTDGEAVSY